MLYFRFDKDKDSFKGSKHKSVFMGDDVWEYCYDLFDNSEAPEEYQKIYDDGDEDVIEDYINDVLTIDGCSCFELNRAGLDEACTYSFFDTMGVVTVFEGDFVEYGHDGEIVAKCNNIIEQLSPTEFLNKYENKLK